LAAEGVVIAVSGLTAGRYPVDARLEPSPTEVWDSAMALFGTAIAYEVVGRRSRRQ
jgi:hypothetical protein